MLDEDRRYTRVYALGFETLVGEFLQMSSRSDEIRSALCTAFDWKSEQIKGDADALLAEVEGKSEEELLEMDDLKALALGKYSYSTGAGLIVLMQKAGLDPTTAIPVWCEKLGLNCKGALSRDYAYYKSSIEKLGQLKDMLAQMKEASEKQAAAREAAKAAATE